MAADDNGLRPAGHQAGHVAADDRLPKDRATDDIADGAVRRLPHLLQVKLLHPRLVRGDGGALDADLMLLDRLRRRNRDLILGGVAVLYRQIVVFQIDVQIGQDQLVLDKLPDDPGHLVAVKLDQRILYRNFLHGIPLLLLIIAVSGKTTHYLYLHST